MNVLAVERFFDGYGVGAKFCNEFNQTLAYDAQALNAPKRRWRGIAADGREFGFDLEHALADGDAFLRDGTKLYVIAQEAEPVLEIALGTDSPTAARLGWLIGNLHFQIEVTKDVVRVADDPALRQLFEREHIPFTTANQVLTPLGGGHHH